MRSTRRTTKRRPRCRLRSFKHPLTLQQLPHGPPTYTHASLDRVVRPRYLSTPLLPLRPLLLDPLCLLRLPGREETGSRGPPTAPLLLSSGPTHDLTTLTLIKGHYTAPRIRYTIYTHIHILDGASKVMFDSARRSCCTKGFFSCVAVPGSSLLLSLDVQLSPCFAQDLHAARQRTRCRIRSHPFCLLSRISAGPTHSE